MARRRTRQKERKRGAVTYRQKVRGRLRALNPVFARAAIGDFAVDVKFPKEEDEFTEFYTGIQIMLEVVREKIAELALLTQRQQARISGLEETKEEIGQEKAQLSAILDSMGEGLAVVRKDGAVVLMNQTALTMLRVKLEAVIGRPWYEVCVAQTMDGAPIPRKDRAITRVLKSGEKVVAKQRYMRADTHCIPVAVTFAPVELNGKIAGVVVVFRDISHEAEVDRAKSEFVSIVSHQLGTPLSTMRWYLEALQEDGALPPGRHVQLKEVETATLKMIDLVDHLLNVSRIEMGTYVQSPQAVDPVATARETVKEFVPVAFAQEITLEESYGEGAPSVWCDPSLLRIVFQNFLSNALKHTSAGGKVEVRVEREGGFEAAGVGSSEAVKVTVTDTGSGIPLAYQGRIFEKFYRAPERTQPQSGQGLGLYIVKVIVERAGGKIWFSSEEGKGSSFFVRFPAYMPSISSTPVPSTSQAKSIAFAQAYGH